MAVEKVRRTDWEKIGKLPLLSLGLACVLLASFPVLHFGYSTLRTSVRTDFDAAVDFAIRNPSVQIPPRLLPVIRAVLPDFDSNETFAFLNKSRGENARQKEFEGLVTSAFEQLDSHPFRALGVVPATPRIAGFAAHAFVHVGWVQLLGGVLLLLLAGATFVSVRAMQGWAYPFGFGKNPKHYPERALDFLEAQGIRGRIFNTDL